MIDKLKNLIFFKLSVVYLRYLIGFAFVLSSFIKIQGERFTQIPPDQPVGHFFEAMYQTGFYWKFLGWSQLIAGSLMVTQRFATVGTMMFFPIILNVCLITHSVNFGIGTPIITTLMLIGTIYLLLWDYKKWIILFYKDHRIKLDLTNESEDRFLNDPTWTFTGIIFIVLSAYPWIFKGKSFGWWMLAMIIVGIAAFVIAMIRWRSMKKLGQKVIEV